MLSEKLTIINPEGLHMRPAAVFAQEMGKFECEINIIHNGSSFNAKSLISIISAVIKCGTDIELVCSGNDEQAAMDRAKELIRSGFTNV